MKENDENNVIPDLESGINLSEAMIIAEEEALRVFLASAEYTELEEQDEAWLDKEFDRYLELITL